MFDDKKQEFWSSLGKTGVFNMCMNTILMTTNPKMSIYDLEI